MADEDDEPTGQARAHERSARPGGSLRQIVLFYGVGALFVLLLGLLWAASKVLLLVFAGVLLAILLYHASQCLQRWLPLSRGPALGLVVLLALLLFGLGAWALAPQVAEQSNQLFDALSRALQRVQASLERYGYLQAILGQLPPPEAMASYASSMMARAGVFFSGVLGAVANVAIVAFLAIYFAAQPRWYLDGLIALVPLDRRPRARQVLDELGQTLAQWLLGKLLSMLIVGIATAVGLALLGVPLALVLGILAGLLDFIPYLGPILAGVPAVLIAFAERPMLGLYAALLFVGLQAAEGYLLLPMVERRTVSLPPALTITMQVLLGALFGLAGIALATPLTAVIVVLVTMLYVQDVLGDQVRTPSEH